MNVKYWNLVADVGGTNARFGLMDPTTGKLDVIEYYSVQEHAAFTDALGHFLEEVDTRGGWARRPSAACIAVASPVEKDLIKFTNSPWHLHRQEVAGMLNLAAVDVINDFAAVGQAVAVLQPGDWRQVGGAEPVPGKPVAVIGPGTGLGVCTLVGTGMGYQVVDGEGGHVDFAPVDAREVAVLELLLERFERVSVERLLSGAGIVTLHQSLATLAGRGPSADTPARITELAIAGEDSLAVDTLQMFCRILGSTAGNLALTVGATGGVYIAGGIVPRFIDFLAQSDFRRRFESKGRFHSYLVDIPVRVITKGHLGLFGAARRVQGSAL